jgi:hypothetical protein
MWLNLETWVYCIFSGQEDFLHYKTARNYIIVLNLLLSEENFSFHIIWLYNSSSSSSSSNIVKLDLPVWAGHCVTQYEFTAASNRGEIITARKKNSQRLRRDALENKWSAKCRGSSRVWLVTQHLSVYRRVLNITSIRKYGSLWYIYCPKGALVVTPDSYPGDSVFGSACRPTNLTGSVMFHRVCSGECCYRSSEPLLSNSQLFYHSTQYLNCLQLIISGKNLIEASFPSNASVHI